MKKLKKKTQFEKWFKSQFHKPPAENYYKLLDRRATLLTELAVVEALVARHEVYNTCYNAARRTEAAAKRRFKKNKS
jgi:hypothetical protein